MCFCCISASGLTELFNMHHMLQIFIKALPKDHVSESVSDKGRGAAGLQSIQTLIGEWILESQSCGIWIRVIVLYVLFFFSLNKKEDRALKINLSRTLSNSLDNSDLD